MARSVTSSAFGSSAWKPWYAPHTASTTSAAVPPRAASTSAEEPLVAEALARRRLRHRSRRRCRAGRGRPAPAGWFAPTRSSRVNAPSSGPDPSSHVIGPPSAGTSRGGSWPAFASRSSPRRSSTVAHRAVMYSADRRSSTRIRLTSSSAPAGVRTLVDRGAEERSGERHEEGRSDALAGHVGDARAQAAPARPRIRNASKKSPPTWRAAS